VLLAIARMLAEANALRKAVEAGLDERLETLFAEARAAEIPLAVARVIALVVDDRRHPPEKVLASPAEALVAHAAVEVQHARDIRDGGVEVGRFLRRLLGEETAEEVAAREATPVCEGCGDEIDPEDALSCAGEGCGDPACQAMFCSDACGSMHGEDDEDDEEDDPADASFEVGDGDEDRLQDASLGEDESDDGPAEGAIATVDASADHERRHFAHGPGAAPELAAFARAYVVQSGHGGERDAGELAKALNAGRMSHGSPTGCGYDTSSGRVTAACPEFGEVRWTTRAIAAAYLAAVEQEVAA